MENILLAIDIDGNEKELIERAIPFAQAFQAKIWLVHVAAPDPDFTEYEVGSQYVKVNSSSPHTSDFSKEHRKLQAYSKALYEKGIEAEGILMQGATVDMVIAEAKQLDIELIIIGRQERGFFYNLFLGSVSSGVVKQSKIPVLVIPIDE